MTKREERIIMQRHVITEDEIILAIKSLFKGE